MPDMLPEPDIPFMLESGMPAMGWPFGADDDAGVIGAEESPGVEAPLSLGAQPARSSDTVARPAI